MKKSNNNNSRKNLRYALLYASKGWPVLPVHTVTAVGCSCRNAECQNIGKHPRTPHGVKDATTDEKTITAWFKKWPYANIGIATGMESGLVVLDIDPRHDGKNSLRKLREKYGALPNTLRVRTGGGGLHIYFRHPGDQSIKNVTGIRDYPGLDLKADGGYVVAPPSIHQTRKKYEFRHPQNQTKLHVAQLPASLKDLVCQRSHRSILDIDTPSSSKIFREGERNARLASEAGRLLRNGHSAHMMRKVLLAMNREECEPPLPPSEVRSIAKSISRYAASDVFAQTDSGNAERLVAQFGNDIRFCKPLGGWYIWDGKRWIVDRTFQVNAYSKICARLIAGETKAGE